jgi:hypothetical protein
MRTSPILQPCPAEYLLKGHACDTRSTKCKAGSDRFPCVLLRVASSA